MNERVKRLIAIGASVGANCHPCIEFHVGKALELGIEKGEILEAVEQAKAVRKGAAASMDALALKLVGEEATVGKTGGAGKPICGCSC